jgi:hypothetical protein
MAEDRFQLVANGQELQKDDVNLVAKEAALADDRVLAELLRLAPFDGARVAKAILPFGHAGASGPTVAPNGASGSALIAPFRAVIGSRTPVQGGAKDTWRDVRSAIYTGSPTSLTGTIAFAPNPSTNSRWDLVYAVVAVDANGGAMQRFAKDAATKVVNLQTLVTTLTNPVTVGVVPGTPAAAPAAPALPNDAGGAFYVPLALVHIAPGFSATSTLSPLDIADVAPIARLTRGLSGTVLRPADVHFEAGGSYLTAARLGDWGTGGNRPPLALPPSMAGGDAVVLALQLVDPNDRGWIADGAILDHSVDWRNRLFRVHYQLRSANATLAWSRTSSPWPTMPSPFRGNPQTARVQGFDFSQSFQEDGTLFGGFAGAAVFVIDQPSAAFMAPNTRIAVYVDLATGNLRLATTGTPGAFALLWIEATAPYPNA